MLREQRLTGCATAIILRDTTSVLEGYLVLEDMHIKKSLLDTLELPLTLKHGIIGRLEIRIPWSNLHKESIVIDIDRVRKNRRCGVGTVYTAPLSVTIPLTPPPGPGYVGMRGSMV